ncbi:MAG: FecR domain-containing protein [Deltaproteobacteria bacterium]|nr:FecR domain-containing protein [Deltaproteobacteria bacterium]
MEKKSNAMTPRKQAKFQAWLEKDPNHKAQLELMNTIWECADVLHDHPLIINDLEDQPPKRRTNAIGLWYEKLRPRVLVLKPVAIAAIALVLTVGIWMNQSQKPVSKRFQTGIGEQKMVQLDDASQIQLDTDTLMSVQFTEKSRQVKLARGRAFFAVTRDLHRPFVVETAQTVVRALGTEFSVYNNNRNRITVAVLDGSVLVSQNPTLHEKHKKHESQDRITARDPAQEKKIGESSQTTLPFQEIIVSGEEITISVEEQVHKVTSIELNRVNGWRSGRLLFKKAPLNEIIDEINRYLTQKISIGDESLEDIEITINFDVNSGKHFIPALEKLIPVTSDVTTDGRIVITKRD